MPYPDQPQNPTEAFKYLQASKNRGYGTTVGQGGATIPQWESKWEARRQNAIDRIRGLYLGNFGQGGAYGPERIMGLFQQQYGRELPMISAPGNVTAERVSAGPTTQAAFTPSWSAGNQYGQGAMDLAARSAAIASGNAAQGLGGLSPAARMAALSGISRQAAAGVGEAGINAQMQGLGMQQQTALANQQAQMQDRVRMLQAAMANQSTGLQAGLANQDVAMRTALANQGVGMQDRMAMLGLFGQGVQNAYGAGMWSAQALNDSIRNQWQNNYQANQAKQGMMGNAIGGVVGQVAGGLVGGLVGGPPGAAIGAGVGSQIFGGPRTQTTGGNTTPTSFYGQGQFANTPWWAMPLGYSGYGG